MSNCLIVVDGHNADRNTVTEIAAALSETGSIVIHVDDAQLIIEAAVPSHELPTISAIDGVSYVRSVFSYFCGNSPLKAA